MSNKNTMDYKVGRIPIPRRGFMLVLSSPSGAGKTTISRRLLDADDNLHLSVSVTTRPPRPAEIHARDYFFIDNEEFGLMVNRQELLEYAKVFDYYYGTPKEAVEYRLANGQDVLFDIDWQGTQQLMQTSKSDLVTVFILPPSMRELERRLHTRAQDPAHVVAKRMSKAADEISHWAEYDYVIVNHNIERSLEEVKTIIAAERLRRHRATGLIDFVKQLREGR